MKFSFIKSNDKDEVIVYSKERNDLIKIEKLFNDIYNSNYKLVYFCVANFIKNKLDIEEIVDDVFINFYNLL